MINENTLPDYIRRLRDGELAALAQVMTLVESQHPAHQALSALLFKAIMPLTQPALRLGVTGPPGAGKSTFIDALGMLLIDKGLRVAIIAIDPSSPISGGSILGDKIRMPRLSFAKGAFIRPVPAGGHLGGTSQMTSELVMLCEAAGYDIVIVETVGVGQSEIEVARIVDCLISLQIAGAGDSLQGIKRGIMEMADLIVINKDDGDNHCRVVAARQIYESALHILRRKYREWKPHVLTCSALEKKGIEKVWQVITQFRMTLEQSGMLQQHRQNQAVEWLEEQVKAEAIRFLFARPEFADYYRKTLADVSNNDLSPRRGLRRISHFLQHHYFN